RRVAAAIERAEERVAAAAAAQGEERLARIGREARGAVRNAAAAVIAAYIAYKALFAGPTAQPPPLDPSGSAAAAPAAR
ncbi:hypothetical protein HK405_005545, partial [Cladochytrium tenue]